MYHNTLSLYNVHSYMFRHLCVILWEFKVKINMYVDLHVK